MTQHGTGSQSQRKNRLSKNHSVGFASSSESYEIECHCIVDSASQMSTAEYVIECDCKPAYNKNASSKRQDRRTRSPKRSPRGATPDVKLCQCAANKRNESPQNDEKKYRDDISKIAHKKCKVLDRIDSQIRAREKLFKSKDYKCCPKLWTLFQKIIGKYPANGLLILALLVLLLLLTWGLLAYGAMTGASECGKNCLTHKATIY